MAISRNLVSRDELKSVENCVAKTVMVESANRFSLEELSRTQYSLKYSSKPYRPSDRLEKPLKASTEYLLNFQHANERALIFFQISEP